MENDRPDKPDMIRVMLHGFVYLDEDNEPCRDTGKECRAEEYADHDPDAWNVWVRLDYPDGEIDEIGDMSRDFVSFAAALDYAEKLVAENGWELEVY